jgi:hypothetical protein
MKRISIIIITGLLWVSGCKECPECPSLEEKKAAADTDTAVKTADSSTAPETADTDSAFKAAPIGGKPSPVTSFPLYGRAGFDKVNIWEKPDMDSTRIGYMRRGARTRLGDPKFSSESCPEGWFQLEQGGFACQGKGMLVGTKPRSILRPPPPPRVDMLDPYRHGFIRADWTPSYKRLPSNEDMWKLPEREVVDTAVGPRPPDSTDTTPVPMEIIPHQLPDDTDTSIDGIDYNKYVRKFRAIRQLMMRGFWVSVQDRLRDEKTGQYYYETVKGEFVPGPAVHLVKPPEFRGYVVRGDTPLPAAIVRSPYAAFYARRNGRFQGIGPAEKHSVYRVLSEDGAPGNRYFEIEGERWLKESQVAYFGMRDQLPEGVGEKEKWIRVDLTNQTLEAWEGLTPILVTLISSGLPDSEETETPRGRFRINFKHVTDDMAGSVGDGEEVYQVEDVSWVQYIHNNIALHGAFWHSRFGQPRSHGCINLSPADARVLFDWSDPPLPEGWHAVAVKDKTAGTLVIIEGKTPK